jgi:uncharacterized protein YcbK (DUF882 family)
MEFLRAHVHLQGKAIDIRVPGVGSSSFRDAVLELHRGSVGYYAKSDVVQVDVGSACRW